MGVDVPRKKVTLAMVAQRCGVAISTVSRALAHPERVGHETAERVARAVEELDYRPPGARSASTRTRTLAMLVPNLVNPYTMDIVRGAQAQAQAAGYRFAVANFMESVQLETDFLTEFSRTSDAVIVSSPRSPSEHLKRMTERVPLIIINRVVPGVSSVVVDAAEGMRDAVDHLCDLGHTSLGYVRGPDSSWSDRRRFLSLQERSAKRGVEFQSIGSYFPSLRNGSAAADAVLLSGVSSVVFFDDILAIGALTRFAELGVSIPDDISVIGCDDIFGASFCNPPLTTVTAPGEAVGHAAADFLITSVGDDAKPRHNHRFRPHLTVRQSTGTPRAAASIN